MTGLPPMDPNTDEASEIQLARALEQGAAYGRALGLMTSDIALTGGETRVGNYLVGYAIEEGEGMYSMDEGGLRWHEPEDENTHVEIAVRDAADGRFIPGLDITVTMLDANGAEIGSAKHELVWHPMLYHYAHNWRLPADGSYSIRVDFAPPAFMRHDRVNGRRFTEPCRVEFPDVEIFTVGD